MNIDLFVYGTLLRTEPYHHLIEHCPLVTTAETLPEFNLLLLGHYPGLQEGGTTSVVGEIYSVDPATLEQLDEYEECPKDYVRKSIDFKTGHRAQAYIIRNPPSDAPEIASGNWIQFFRP